MNHLRVESGFVSLWLSSATLLLLLFGLTFFMYSEATITKMKTQFMVNNLAITGSHNSEFDSPEALNNMKLLATSYGYEGVGSVERVQTSNDGSTSLFFSLENAPGPRYGSHVLITLKKSPLFDLFNLSELKTASYARAEPAPLYIDLAFDYSHSLTGGSITELLQAFDVIDSTGLAPGANGEILDDEIVPKKEIQTLLPHSIDPWTGIILPWEEASTIWANVRSTDPGCTTTEENICPNSQAIILPHKEVLRLKSADLFLHYKKAAALLTGIFGSKTQFADVHIFGGRMSDQAHILYSEMLSPLQTNQSTTGFTTLENNGLYTVSEFDELSYSSFSFNPPITLSGNVSTDYTHDNPKDLIRDPVSFAPNRPLQLFLDNTFSRKLLKYVALKDPLNNQTLVPAGRYYEVLNPNIPQLLESPLLDDSFAFNPGVLVDGNPASGENEQFLSGAGLFLLGWSSQPIPILGQLGSAFIAEGSVPWYIRYPLEYNCSTGIPIDNAAQMSQNSYRLGQRLCLLHEACSGTNYNCDGAGGTNLSSIQDAYRIRIAGEYQRNSPGCEGSSVARCFGLQIVGGIWSLSNSPDNLNVPICINGVARCHPSIELQPRCYDESTNTRSTTSFPDCCDNSTGACNPDYTPHGTKPRTHTAVTSGDTDTIGSTNGAPLSRGYLDFPDIQPVDVQNNIFHFLMDLTTLQGGTWTHSAVAKAASRCQEFKTHFRGMDPECVLIMTTDGMPNGIDSLGQEIESSETMIEKLSTEINNFSHPTAGQNGKVFTWYLNHQPSEYERIVTQLQQLELAGTLDDSMVQILNDYILSETAIPDEFFSAWESSRVEGLPAAKVFNNSVLPEHQERSQLRSNFINTVSPSPQNSNLRYFATTASNSDRTGLAIPLEFLQYLEQTAVRLKREIKFQK